ncbi:MAG: hypothetical protein P8178_19035, partial [Candidatus Thiodiazotropha sp.]
MLIAVEGFGLYLLEPENGSVVSTRSLAPRVVHMAAGEGGVAIAYGARVELLSLQGSQLQSVQPLELNETLLDLRAYGNSYLLLTASRLQRIGAAGTLLAQFDGLGFTALAVSDHRLLLARNDGALIQLDDNLQGDAFDLGVEAERLFTLNGKLLALSGRSGLVQIIDIATDTALQKTAQWRLPLQADLSAATLAGGRVWLGGRVGQILDITSGSSGFVTLYDSQVSGDGVSGSVRDLALSDGRLIAAADNYGATILSQQGTGTWNRANYPVQTYTRTASAVAAGGNRLFVLQPQAQQLVALDRQTQSASMVMQNLSGSDLALTNDEVVMSAGGDLHLARLDKLTDQRTIPVSDESLVRIAGSGAMLTALTDTGRLLLVDTRPERPQSEQVVELALDVDDATLNGDLVFARSGNALKRIKLYDLATDGVTLSGTPVLVSLQKGRLWVVTEETGAFVLQAVDPYDLSVIGNVRQTLPARPTAIAVEHDRIAIGYGSERLQILRLPQVLDGGERALLEPAAHLSYHASDRIPASLESQGVAAVAYLIDDKRVATITQPPFERQLAIPPQLPNGSAFELSTQVEFTTGQVVDNALPRQLFLQSENSVGNAFEVNLAFDEHTWLPKPLKLSATVSGSSQPIAEVEFLMAAAADGPWRQLAQHAGGDYEIALDIGTENSGYYLMARAVDAFGNMAKSTPKRFYRHLDQTGPSATISLLGN